jgi:DNA-binding beta-propeller fold protein YncE
MANYTKTTDFAAKDTLPGGDTNKVVRGTEFETEFDAISTAIATKSDTASPTFTGTVTVPTADINGGNIDGTVIGASTAAAGTFTDLTATGTVDFDGATVSNLGTITTANLDGGTVDNSVIGGATPAAGTFTDLTANTSFTSGNVDINGGAIDGATIGANSAAAGTFSSLTATTADINGGSIDGAVIGGSSTAAISGTTGTFSGAVTGSNLNVSNWDTAFGWGDHSTEGYLTSVAFSNLDAGAVTLSSETFSDVDNQVPTNAAVIDYVAATIPLITETNDLSAIVTWATVPDAYISASSVNQHVSVEKATQSKTYVLNEQSTLTLSSSITSGVPIVSVTKEVAQSGVSNNDWDVDSTTENYTRLNSATATTLNFNLFDVAGAAYSQNFSVSSQDNNPDGIAFNADGTKMFMVGRTNDSVFEYALSTGFDVSTASYTQSFSVASQEISPSGLAFNADGTKMFVVGFDGDDVNEYTLSTGFDVSTASYSQNFSVSTQETDPTDIAFNSDGTKMFIVGQTSDNVNEYALSTGFDLSTASYTQNFSVNSQETNPHGLAFNTDGTKMFVVGIGGDDVNQYTLSTGFDVSTASFSKLFSVSAEDTAPKSIRFNTDGTKMFILGDTGDDVNEYNITPASVFLGTGSFTSADVGKTIEANSGVFVLTSTAGAFSTTTAPTSYDQVASGSWEMYAVVYNTTDGDLELSGFVEGFDISTASFVTSFSTSTQDTEPHGIAFNTDGTKMFVLGEQGDDVSEYTLTTGFDISTASYSQNFSVLSQDSGPQDIAFNTDGTKMFIAGDAGNDINEYTLTTGFDLSTASYSQNFTGISSQGTAPQGITFNDDGTKFYFCDSNNRTIFQYTLTTAFDISTASYASKSFSMANEDLTPQSIRFNNDGTKLFMTGDTSDNVNEYELSTAFDVSTTSFVRSFSVASQENEPKGLAFNADGTKMYVSGRGSDGVNEYTIGTAAIPSGYHAVHTTDSTDSIYWTDVNSMAADEAAGDGAIYYAVSTDDRTTWKIAKGTDGERSIVRNNSGTWQFNSNGTYGSTTWSNAATNTELAALQEAMEGATDVTGFSITSASYDSKTFDPASQETNPRDIAFNSDGTKAYFIGVGADTVFQYSLSTAYDISTASYDSVSFSIASQENEPQGLTFNSDGTKMFVVGTTGDDVNEYTLSTGFDLSTASYSQVFSVSAQDSAPSAIKFNSDGTKMFIAGAGSETIYQYTLTTGFDVSTASYASKSISVLSEESVLQGLAFNNDGTKMFITGTNGDEINEYTLTTGFDLSTASFSSNLFDVSSQSTGPQSVTFNSDGTKMYITDNNGVFQYSSTSTSYTNQMNKTQLDAVPDANHFTLGDDLDLAIIFNLSSGTTAPSSDGVSINFDANSLNQGAVLGTDYEWDFPASNKVRIKSLAAQNLKVRII